MPTYKEMLNSLNLPARFDSFDGWWGNSYALEWQGDNNYIYLQQDAIQVITLASIVTSLRRYNMTDFHKVISGDACYKNNPEIHDGEFHPIGNHGPNLRNWDFCYKTLRGCSPYTQRSYAPINADITKIVYNGEVTEDFDANWTATFMAFLSRPYLLFGEDGRTVIGSNIEIIVDDIIYHALVRIYNFLSFVLVPDFDDIYSDHYMYHDCHGHVSFKGVADLGVDVY